MGVRRDLENLALVPKGHANELISVDKVESDGEWYVSINTWIQSEQRLDVGVVLPVSMLGELIEELNRINVTV